MKSFLVDQDGYYGEFGGAYVPEILHKCVEELKNTYLGVLESEDFKKEFDQLLRDYVGRPSPLYLARRLSEKYGCKMYLKREDNAGAHRVSRGRGCRCEHARRKGTRKLPFNPLRHIHKSGGCLRRRDERERESQGH